MNNTAPTATASGDTTGVEGSTLNYSASATDPSTADTAGLTYAWNAVDATGTSVGTGTGAGFSMTYADDGVYTVTVTASDDDGGTDTATVTSTVGNAAPTVTLLSSLNSPWTNRTTMALFPTPVSPRSTSLTRVSLGTPGTTDPSARAPGADGPLGALTPRSSA